MVTKDNSVVFSSNPWIYKREGKYERHVSSFTSEKQGQITNMFHKMLKLQNNIEDHILFYFPLYIKRSLSSYSANFHQ